MPTPLRQRAAVMAAAAASLAALVTIGFNLPDSVTRAPASASPAPVVAPASEVPEASLFTVERQDLVCPDLNELDIVPQIDGGRYEVAPHRTDTEFDIRYECDGEPEEFETHYYDDELSEPVVRVFLSIAVHADPVDASVAAGRSMASDYFDDWDHASHSAEIDDGRFPSSSPLTWMDYSLSALEANLVLTVNIDYLYTDDDFDAAAASRELAETIAESVVAQIPRA